METNINPLIVFLSCKKNEYLWNNLLKTTKNSIIFYGNTNINEKYIYKDRILILNCKDTYDALPIKIYLMIKTILQIPEFKNITHILKVDDHDTKITEDINSKIINNKITDYCGQNLHNAYIGNRKWHFNKIPKNSIWYNKEYNGDFVPWIDGGCGYILSKKSMQVISNENINEINNHIYEDVMIGLILHKNNIFPNKINKIIIGDKINK